MREIKTITKNSAADFDIEVNTALKEGWELNRREAFITPEYIPFYYAELERIVVPYEVSPEIDEYEEEAHWHITKDPRLPYRCSTCLFKSTTPYAVCPSCGSLMSDDIEE